MLSYHIISDWASDRQHSSLSGLESRKRRSLSFSYLNYFCSGFREKNLHCRDAYHTSFVVYIFYCILLLYYFGPNVAIPPELRLVAPHLAVIRLDAVDLIPPSAGSVVCWLGPSADFAIVKRLVNVRKRYSFSGRASFNVLAIIKHTKTECWICNTMINSSFS